MNLREKRLRTGCLFCCVTFSLLPACTSAQVGDLLKDKLDILLKQDKDASNTRVTNTVPITVDQATLMGIANCIESGQEKKAAVFTLFNRVANQSELSKYLVGLCVPNNFLGQFQLNEYLMSKGSVHSFHSERYLEELADHIESAGVDLGFKREALENEKKFKRKLEKENNLEQANYLLDQSTRNGRKADMYVSAIAKLEAEQKASALELAAKARAHAGHATYYLTRGVYITSKMAENFDYKTLVSPTSLLLRAKRSKSMEDRFVIFVQNNLNALPRALNNAFTLVSAFDTDLKEIPKLDDKAIEEDLTNLNTEWSFPTDFEGEEEHSSANLPIE